MRKEDNDWSFEYKRENSTAFVSINNEEYHVSIEIACLAHTILLLVDAINDTPSIKMKT